MADEMSGSPTIQSLEYQVGLVDNTSDNLEGINQGFNRSVGAIEQMIDALQKLSTRSAMTSSMYVASMEGLLKAIPGLHRENVMLFTEDFAKLSQRIGLKSEELDKLAAEIKSSKTPDLIASEFWKAFRLSKGRDDFIKNFTAGVKDVSKNVFGLEAESSLGKFFAIFTRKFEGTGFMAQMSRVFGPGGMVLSTVAKIGKMAFGPAMESLQYFGKRAFEPIQRMLFSVVMTLRPFFNRLIAMSTQFAKDVSPILNKVMTNLIPVLIGLTELGFKIVGAFLPVVNVLAKFTGWVLQSKTATVSLGIAITSLYLAIKGAAIVSLFTGLNTGVIGLGLSIWKVIPAIWSFTVALLSNPITWVIAGVVALGAALVLLVKYWDNVAHAAKTALKWMTLGLVDLNKADKEAVASVNDIENMKRAPEKKLIIETTQKYQIEPEVDLRKMANMNLRAGLQGQIQEGGFSREEYRSDVNNIMDRSVRVTERMTESERVYSRTALKLQPVEIKKDTIKIPEPVYRKENSRRDITDPITSQLDKVGKMIVNSIDGLKLGEDAFDVDDELRKLGSFA